MPEETETVEQQDTGTAETVEETTTEGNGTAEAAEDAQEADAGGEEKPFDRKKFEAELRKKNRAGGCRAAAHQGFREDGV
jgi:hypothetical protein